MNKRPTDRIHEWVFFAFSFLDISKLGLAELLKTKNDRTLLFGENLNSILISVLWNFKHAMEISIKHLTALSDHYYLKTHDQKSLLTDLAYTLEQNNIPKPDNIDDFFPLFFKYYNMEMFNNKILEKSIIKDQQNDVLRFPHNSARFDLNIKAFKYITKNDLKDLKRDIELFEEFLFYFDEEIQKANAKL